MGYHGFQDHLREATLGATLHPPSTNDPKAESSMPVSTSEYFHLDTDVLERAGAFDAILDRDTPLFINPALLKRTQVPELVGAYPRVLEHFRKVIAILKKGDHEEVFMEALSVFKYGEAEGLCLGHSKHSTAGERSSTGWVKERLLRTVQRMVRAGVDEPETFEVAAWLAPHLGPDRVSDLIATIALPDIRNYSIRVFREAGLKNGRFQWKDGFLPAHPFAKSESGGPTELHLIPHAILSSFDSAREDIAQLTSDIRRILMPAVARSVKQSSDERKQASIDLLVHETARLRQIIRNLKEMQGTGYDPRKDRLGIIAGHSAGRKLIEKNQNAVVPSGIPEMARTLISIFARDIEHAGDWEDLYTGTKTRNEDCAQDMFWRLGNHLAETRGAKLLREPNIGKAEPDFLLTNGTESAIIELKLTKHRRIKHARAQLRKYLNILPQAHGFLVVIHIKDVGTEALRRAFLKAETTAPPDRRIEAVLIDGTPKESPARASENTERKSVVVKQGAAL